MYILQNHLLFDIGAIIIVATFLAYVARLLKQPVIPSYMIAGILLGPFLLKLVKNVELITPMSEIGIAFLLFVAGLEMNFKKLRKVGSVILFGSLIQIAVTFGFGFFLGLLLKLTKFESFILGLVVAFSSTMIVVKLLSDKRELDTLHGRITLGTLLVQDLVVILLLPLATKSFQAHYIEGYAYLLAKGLVLVLLAVLLNKFFVDRIFKFAAKTQELLFLTSISFCFIFSLLAYSFGFSIAVGAFVSGMMLANLPYHYDIIGRIKPLRDFFLTIFFAYLGIQMTFLDIKPIIIALFAFLMLVVIIKPMIILAIVNLFGYGKRASFLTGISLAQISEFSLIIVMLAKDFISKELFSMTIILAVISIATTTYFIKYDEKLYNKLSKYLGLIEIFPRKYHELGFKTKTKPKIVLFGCHRMGTIILKALSKMRKHVLVVDFNPAVITKLMKQKINCIYGDATNPELLENINFKEMEIVISTIPNEDENEHLIKYAKSKNSKLLILVVANNLFEALNLYEAGADYVILPPIVGGERISHILSDIVKARKDIKELKKRHLKHLIELEAEGT